MVSAFVGRVTDQFYERALAHGVWQGTVSEVQGGRFQDGFLSAGFSVIVGNSLYGESKGFSLQRAAVQAAVGGTASVIGGGKFANGAYAAAFVYAYNEALSANAMSCGVAAGGAALVCGGAAAASATACAGTFGAGCVSAPLAAAICDIAVASAAGACVMANSNGANSEGEPEASNPKDVPTGKVKDVPNRGEPGEVKEGQRRTREYGADGKPARDNDKNIY